MTGQATGPIKGPVVKGGSNAPPVTGRTIAAEPAPVTTKLSIVATLKPPSITIKFE